jgi:hypothetical protein
VILCPREWEGFAGKPLVGKSGFRAIQDVEAIGISSTAGSEKERGVVGQFHVRHDPVGI